MCATASVRVHQYIVVISFGKVRSMLRRWKLRRLEVHVGNHYKSRPLYDQWTTSWYHHSNTCSIFIRICRHWQTNIRLVLIIVLIMLYVHLYFTTIAIVVKYKWTINMVFHKIHRVKMVNNNTLPYTSHALSHKTYAELLKVDFPKLFCQ